MFDQILNRMREKIRRREYIMTYHARREMDYDLDVDTDKLSRRIEKEVKKSVYA